MAKSLDERFVWVAKGMNLAQRVRHLEERWAYYLAFGEFRINIITMNLQRSTQ